MEFLALRNPRSNKSEESEEAINGESKENCKGTGTGTGTGKAGFSFLMKLMEGYNPATQLSLSSCSAELKESYSSKDLCTSGSAIPVLAQSHLEGSARPAVPEKQSGVSPQLTIFYGGMVNVFDDISADKAQAIMLLASSGNHGSFRSQSPPEKSVSLAVYSKPTRNVSDLPIARKQSLQRFLEKRQDRRQTKTPYATDESGKPKQNPHLTSSSPTLQAN